MKNLLAKFRSACAVTPDELEEFQRCIAVASFLHDLESVRRFRRGLLFRQRWPILSAIVSAVKGGGL